MSSKRINVVAGIASVALALATASAFAQVAPNLGTAGAFTALGTNPIPTSGTFTCTNTTVSNVFGSVGTTFTSITNTGCNITGPIVAPVAAAVPTDLANARAAIDAQVCTGTIPIVTTTLAPGVYCSAAGTTIGAGVILTLSGTASDVWIFRVGTGGGGALALTSAQVVMGGAASACNVYWRTAQAATLTTSTFSGNVLAGTAFTSTDSSMTGRALAATDVTLTNPGPLQGCAAAVTPPPLGGAVATPTLSEWAMITMALLLGLVGFGALRRKL
jgi:hypothetical protein